MRSILFAGVAALLCAAQLARAALEEPKLSYVLKSGKLALSTVDGSSRLTKDFATTSDYSAHSSPFDLSRPTQLENDDVIRLTFSLSVEEIGKKPVAKEGPALGKEHVPHQAFAVLADPTADENNAANGQHIWPLTVKPATGKVSWTLRMDRIPPALLRSSSPLTLSLLIGNFPTNSAAQGGYAPLHLPLMTVTAPTSLQALANENIAQSPRQKAEQEQGFYGLAEHKHTFSIPPTETMPSRKVCGLASIVTAVVPWSFLVISLGMISPSLESPSARGMVLFASLLGLEALAIKYWIGMTLFAMLPYLLGGGLITIIVGRGALGELRRKRLASSP